MICRRALSAAAAEVYDETSASTLRSGMNRFASSLLIAAAAALAGCGGPAHEGLLTPVAAPAGVGKRIDIEVASSRLRGANPYSFGFGRSHLLNYQAVSVSIPPLHRQGVVELPSRQMADPAATLAALSNQPSTSAEFERRVAAAAAASGGDVSVFVHGFNTTYEEAVFRLAQLAHDSELRGASVLFTWPSRGRVLDYLTDRESAMFSRDRLEIVLGQIARRPEVRRINLLAHSMGALLAMETLRQAKRGGDGEFSGKLNVVLLAAPDIDLDVFRTQLEVIGKRQRPTVVLISTDDQALSLSRTLSGDVERVGIVDVSSPEAMNEIARLGLTIVDLSAAQGSDRYNHDKFARLPAMARELAGLLPGRSHIATQGVVFAVGADGRITVPSDRDSSR